MCTHTHIHMYVIFVTRIDLELIHTHEANMIQGITKQKGLHNSSQGTDQKKQNKKAKTKNKNKKHKGLHKSS